MIKRVVGTYNLTAVLVEKEENGKKVNICSSIRKMMGLMCSL